MIIIIKHTYEYIKEQFENEGYKLLSKEYKNNKQKLSVECDKGHQWKIRWDCFQRGTRCIVCSYIDRGNNQRGKNNPMFGKIFTKEELKKWSDCKKGNKNGMYGKKHTIKSLNKMKEVQKGKTHSNKTLKKMSNSHKGKHIGENNGMYGRCGELSPTWKGGISFEPYCQAWRDKEYKESIKEYYNYQCQNPFCLCDSSDLVLHHIDYDKKNCQPDNIIPVCRSSNAKANYNRWFWQEIYEEIVRLKSENNLNEKQNS